MLPGKVYFDVEIAVVSKSKLITFTEFVRPVCLPYLPVDYEDQFEGKFVTLAGWGYAVEARSGLTELTSYLKLRSLKVIYSYWLRCSWIISSYQHRVIYMNATFWNIKYYVLISNIFQIESLDLCEDFFSKEQFESINGLNSTIREQFLTYGFLDRLHRDLSCVNHNKDDFSTVIYT